MGQRAHRRGLHVQRLCDLVVGQVDEVAQHHHDALAVVQAVQGAAQLDQPLGYLTGLSSATGLCRSSTERSCAHPLTEVRARPVQSVPARSRRPRPGQPRDQRGQPHHGHPLGHEQSLQVGTIGPSHPDRDRAMQRAWKPVLIAEAGQGRRTRGLRAPVGLLLCLQVTRRSRVRGLQSHDRRGSDSAPLPTLASQSDANASCTRLRVSPPQPAEPLPPCHQRGQPHHGHPNPAMEQDSPSRPTVAEARIRRLSGRSRTRAAGSSTPIPECNLQEALQVGAISLRCAPDTTPERQVVAGAARRRWSG